MKIEPRTLKGFRDFLPQDTRKRQFVISKLKKTFELFGFEPLETPTLEYEDILLGKYGEEGDKLMYRFRDNGDRNVALRYDQTVPLARVIAQHKNDISFPFKRYQIQNVFRADNTQKGRFREFLQCDIDTVGTDSVQADIEILQLISQAFKSLGFTSFSIFLNDRSIFDGIPKEGIAIIDKLKKIGKDGVINQLQERNIDPALFEQVTLAQPTERLQKILDSTQNTFFEPTLARGLDYYTATIIEVEVEGYTAGSVGGGGRYDTLIGMFTRSTSSGQAENIPAVGFAFGFDRVIDAMEELKLFPDDISRKTVLVTIFDPNHAEYSGRIVQDLRSKGINSELYLDENTKMDKQLKYADKNNFTYAVIAGPEEVQNNTAVLKNLRARSQETLHTTELANAITVQSQTSS